MTATIPRTVTYTQNDEGVPLSATLQRDGSAHSLAGSTIKFRMETLDGTVVIEETTTGVTVTSEAAGTVQYQWQTNDLATVGVYKAYFVEITSTGKRVTYPHDGPMFLIEVIEA